MRLFRIAVVGGVLAAAGIVPTASATPAEDYVAVRADYGSDHNITACKFSQARLESARSVIPPDQDGYGDPGFRSEVNTEINRWKNGGCAGSGGGGGGGGGGSSDDVRLKIIKIRSKGGVTGSPRESATIKNLGSKKVNLRRYTLRDRAGHKIRFRKKISKLKAGKKLRVFTGCKKGKTKPSRKKGRYYACKSKQLWNGGGDIARVYTPGGTLLSQRGYKSFADVLKF